jgi:homoserine kinase type II
MAVKTAFSDEELRAVLAEYDLGEYRSWKDFGHGADQTNLLLISSRGRYAFRFYEKRSANYVLFEIELLRFLGSKRFPSPEPIQRRDGRFIGAYKASPYSLFSFLVGEHSDDTNNCGVVAEAIGRLHLLTTGYQPAHFEARAAYGQAYALMFAEENAGALKSPLEAETRLRWFRGELESLQLSHELPQGVCHCDPNPSNFLYKDGNIAAVLDFDQSTFTWLLYDVAAMIYWWASPNTGAINIARSRDIIAHYQSIRMMSQKEKEHLFDVLKLVHLVGIGWSFADASFDNDRRKVDNLNSLGRNHFYDLLFAKLF